jgi:hypothetical protein
MLFILPLPASNKMATNNNSRARHNKPERTKKEAPPVHEDEEIQDEKSESTAGETVSDVQTMEEERALSSREEIARSLEILEENIEIEDELGPFTVEDEGELEIEWTQGTLEEVSFALEEVSFALMR